MFTHSSISAFFSAWSVTGNGFQLLTSAKLVPGMSVRFFLHSFITCVQVRASYSISSQYFFQSKNVGLEKCRVPFLVTKKAWDVLTGTWLYNCYWWSIWCPIPKVGTALRQHSIRKRDVNSRRHVSINTNVYIFAWFVMYPAMDGSLSVEG